MQIRVLRACGISCVQHYRRRIDVCQWGRHAWGPRFGLKKHRQKRGEPTPYCHRESQGCRPVREQKSESKFGKVNPERPRAPVLMHLPTRQVFHVRGVVFCCFSCVG